MYPVVCAVFLTDGHDSQTTGIRGSANPGSDGGATGHLPGHGEEGTGEPLTCTNVTARFSASPPKDAQPRAALWSATGQ